MSERLQSHNDRAHAKLSASGSSRWLNCPGSVKAESKYGNDSTSYAQEGTLAHEIADLALKTKSNPMEFAGITLNELGITTEGYDGNHKVAKDMCEYVQYYTDYVMSFVTKNSMLMCEQRVDFSYVVPDGFGTLDSSVIQFDENCIHIFDLKYGKRKVDAVNNTQGLMYLIGLVWEFSPIIDDFKTFYIHICQPRVYDGNTLWQVDMEYLKSFIEQVKKKAQEALSDNAKRVAGEKQCEWCKHTPKCVEHDEWLQTRSDLQFDDFSIGDQECADELSEDTVFNRVKCLPEVEKYLKALKAHVADVLLSGKTFKGFKLIQGKSKRVWNENAESVLVEELTEEHAYNKKLIGLTDAEKLLGKSVVDKLTDKSPGGPSVAFADSPKPEYKALEFDNVEDKL